MFKNYNSAQSKKKNVLKYIGYYIFIKFARKISLRSRKSKFFSNMVHGKVLTGHYGHSSPPSRDPPNVKGGFINYFLRVKSYKTFFSSKPFSPYFLMPLSFPAVFYFAIRFFNFSVITVSHPRETLQSRFLQIFI